MSILSAVAQEPNLSGRLFCSLGGSNIVGAGKLADDIDWTVPAGDAGVSIAVGFQPARHLLVGVNWFNGFNDRADPVPERSSDYLVGTLGAQIPVTKMRSNRQLRFGGNIEFGRTHGETQKSLKGTWIAGVEVFSAYSFNSRLALQLGTSYHRYSEVVATTQLFKYRYRLFGLHLALRYHLFEKGVHA